MSSSILFSLSDTLPPLIDFDSRWCKLVNTSHVFEPHLRLLASWVRPCRDFNEGQGVCEMNTCISGVTSVDGERETDVA